MSIKFQIDRTSFLWRPLGRTSRAVITAFSALLIAGVAVAAWLSTYPGDLNASTRQATIVDLVTDVSATVIANPGGGLVCDTGVTGVPPDRFQVIMTNAFYDTGSGVGSQCRYVFQFQARATNPGNAVIGPVEIINPAVAAAFALPAGSQSVCGGVIPPGALEVVDFDLVLREEATPGTIYNLADAFEISFYPAGTAVVCP